MFDHSILNTTIRDATDADAEQLALLKPTRALHRDRIRQARRGACRYFAADSQGLVVGFGLLYLRPEQGWRRTDHVPLLIDLFVHPRYRSRRIGTTMVETMARAAAELGFEDLYLTVEPERNPRAVELYYRLGFVPLQKEPFLDSYRFTDSGGKTHQGEEWVIEMHKRL